MGSLKILTREFCEKSLKMAFRQILTRSIHTTRAMQMSGGAHGEESIKMWKIASFACVPILLVCHWQAGMLGNSNIDHTKRPPFVKYDHLRIRTKDHWKSVDGKFAI